MGGRELAELGQRLLVLGTVGPLFGGDDVGQAGSAEREASCLDDVCAGGEVFVELAPAIAGGKIG